MRHWPIFDLRLTTPRLELRLPSLDDLDALVDRVLEGVHEPGFMPFGIPWTAAPADILPIASIQHHLGSLASWRRENWHANFMVVHDGQVIGSQTVAGIDFAVTREVSSGSWLGRAWQGRGLGTEMRAAVLHFAFEGLGAESATSSAFTDNPASLAVSRKLGYRENGIQPQVVQGRRRVNQRLRLLRDDFTSPVPVEIHGLDGCRDQFGV
ncbi:GNAT family protein [Planotetraspora phitsanulokensis]|uniref:Succinyl-CoA transferase Rv0802c n=1 Tax=Planotetraspora phitsanulokensis TaxID=575192 RepID=A0A8J3U7E0_9ACTN|nr:GNAT family N-acetyltransferase [Planotetraspora phitsanulokensis]GII40048.1 succinyl-CoA transferase Rv0802c [Planotetraspora phitsanulokensis]